jgi:predicted regulator of Ras-like GTPase activity (Roadblock/LC7/MglB family)
METVLSQLNAVPGVIGSLVCDEDGRLRASVFPPLFDAGLLTDAARCLAVGVAGLDFSPDTSQDLDLRFGEARIVVRPLPGAVLLVLCSRATNHQFLALSASVAVTRLAKLGNAPPAAAAPPAAPAASADRAAPPPAPQRGQGKPAGRGVPLPAKGLEELRKRLAEVADGQAGGAAGDAKKDGAPR